MTMNDFTPHIDIFDGIEPFSGPVETGFLVNFLGVKLDANFRKMWGIDPEQVGGCHMETELPTLEMGEQWFEEFNWIAAAREARGSYVMMTLGACYGSQAVGSYLALQALNPMPATLVAVDGVPENIAWTKKHFLDNGIDPDEHWIIDAAMSNNNEPVIFPVGSPGCGAQNCVSTNSPGFRKKIGDEVISAGHANMVLQSLLLNNSTALKIDLAPGSEYLFEAELRFVSAVTLNDLLGPFTRVDYIEADIQQSEEIVFPPAMAALTAKVRRVHLGTHGEVAHRLMHDLFEAHGWEILFSFEPNSNQETPVGSMELNDGILTAVNPALAYGDCAS